jgi:hypothetical protein
MERSLLILYQCSYHRPCENVSHNVDNVYLVVDTYRVSFFLVSLDCPFIFPDPARAPPDAYASEPREHGRSAVNTLLMPTRR